MPSLIDSSPEDVIQQKLFEHLDYFGDKIVRSQGLDRIKFWNHFERIYEVLEDSGSSKEYGRIYNRGSIVQVAVMLTVAMATSQGVDVGDVRGIGAKMKSITKWSKQEWEHIRDLFVLVANQLTRQDADAKFSEEQNEAVDERRKSSPVFAERLETILKTISVQRVFSPLRESLMILLEERSDFDDEAVLCVSQALLKDFRNDAHREEDQQVQQNLLSILQKPDPDGHIRLIKVGQLRQRLKAKPLCLDHFYTRVNKTLLAWSDATFARTGDSNDKTHKQAKPNPPRREENNNEPFQSSGSMFAGIQRPHAARNQRHKDPPKAQNADSIPIVAATLLPSSLPSPVSSLDSSSARKRARTGTLHVQKPAASTHRQYEDKDDPLEYTSSEDDERDRRAPVSKQVFTPTKRPRAESQQKKYAGRRIWIDTEKDAIKSGLRILGAGKWAAIKEMYPVVLANRTSGQIKDCYRTMLRRGELNDGLIV